MGCVINGHEIVRFGYVCVALVGPVFFKVVIFPFFVMNPKIDIDFFPRSERAVDCEFYVGCFAAYGGY